MDSVRNIVKIIIPAKSKPICSIRERRKQSSRIVLDLRGKHINVGEAKRYIFCFILLSPEPQ